LATLVVVNHFTPRARLEGPPVDAKGDQMRQLMHGPTAPARRRHMLAPAALLGCLAIALAGLILHASPAHASACAAQNNYTGPVDGQWNVEGNWSNKVPKTSETVCIPEGKGTITIAAGVKAEVKTLLAQSAVTVAGTATLTISEKFFMEEPAKDEETATRFTDGLTIDSGAVVSTEGNWILMSGTVLLEGEIFNATGNVNEVTARLESGTLEGEGTMHIPFANIGGTVQPGGPNRIGTLHFVSHSDQGPNGTLVLDIASKTSFDRVALNSEFTWFGTLVVNLLGGYAPTVGTVFEFQTGGGTIGAFEHIAPEYRELDTGGNDTIEVRPRKPTTLTEAATEVTQTSAVIHGSVNPNTEQVTICHLEYGTSNKYTSGSSTCPTPPGNGPSAVPESLLLTSLTPGTTYHFRITAVNSEAGESQGEDLTFTTLPASTGGGETKTTTTETKTPGGGQIADTATTTPKATEELLLGCSKSQLVLNDVYIHGGKVILIGSAAKSLAGKKVAILFNEKKQVAATTVQANGEFSTSAPLPPAKIRDALTTRYSAAIGSVRSLHLKLVRRLLLEPPTASGDTVTLSGRIAKPLTKPIAPVVVEQQLECGKVTIAKTFTPPASGVFRLTLPVPAGTRAAIYTLKSKVAANAHALKKGFTTYSLPLPVSIG
jgi:hypothetical protein